MIILDTNVISELMREVPDERVSSWLTKQRVLHLAITTITIGEIQYGIKRLDRGKRRDQLENRFAAFVAQGFEGRILSFDEPAAHAFGEIAARRNKKELNDNVVDMMIAGIAKSVNASIATRNTKDFAGSGVKLIDPWQTNG